MRVLVAPNAFKGSLSAVAAARAMADGLARLADVELELCPLADGGDGTLDVLVAEKGGRVFECEAADALGRSRRTSWALLDDGSALVETARVAGVAALAPDERNPLDATSRGLGEVLATIARRAPRPARILVGLGGSATIDGGYGLLRALGARAFDEGGIELPGVTADLDRIASLDLAPARAFLAGLPLVGLCDVASPLLGETGASLFFAQKGAHDDEHPRLHSRLARLAACVDGALPTLEGAGAAGGLGLALAALGGRLVSGASFICEAVALGEKIARADLVLSGEGRIDGQTLLGKALAVVAAMARDAARPCVLLCGEEGVDDAERAAMGVAAILSIARGPVAREAMIADAPKLLGRAAFEVVSLARTLSGTGQEAAD